MLVEIPRHGYLKTHLGLAAVDPRIRRVGQHLALEIGVNVLAQRHVLRVAQGAVRYGLALLFDDLSLFVTLGALHNDLVITKLNGVENLAFAVDAVLIAVNLVLERAVSLGNELAAEVGDVVALCADGLAARFKAMARVDELHLARTVRGLVLAQHPNKIGRMVVRLSASAAPATVRAKEKLNRSRIIKRYRNIKMCAYINHPRVFHHAGMIPFPSRSHHPSYGSVGHALVQYVHQERRARLDNLFL